jgi:hypothetical protein
MPYGKGKYDDELTAALKSAGRKSEGKVHGGVLIVRGEPGHNGFSAQLTLEDMHVLPSILRDTAEQIEADLKRGAFSS